MAFIGNQPAESFTSFATQEFSTSATTSYTLDHAVTNENEIALFINNVRQQPGSGKAYTATGTTLTLSAATASTDTMYCVFLGRALQTVTPATNSITAAMVGNDLISGKDALASEPADTDEFLVSDAGTLKRIDYSLIKGGGITGADQWRITGDVQYGTGNQVIDSNWERTDSPTDYGTIGSAMTESSGIFTFPTTGIWLIQHQQSVFRSNGEIQRHDCRILTTTNNSTYVLASQAHIQTDDTNYRTSGFMSFIFDVTDTSTHKVQFGYADASSNNPTLVGSSNEHFTASFFIRLADT